MISCAENPTQEEIVEAFKNLRGYIEFRYRALPECKTSMTPSKAAARRFTRITKPPAEWNVVKGFLGEDSLFKTKDGNYCLRLRNMTRRVVGDIRAVDLFGDRTGDILQVSYFSDKSNKQEDGTRKKGFDDGEYQFRAYRLDAREDGHGIDLSSVMINAGREGKKRLFPNAPRNVKADELRDRLLDEIEKKLVAIRDGMIDAKDALQMSLRKRTQDAGALFFGNPLHEGTCYCMDCLGKAGGVARN